MAVIYGQMTAAVLAVDAADVVLMKSRSTMRNIKQNLYIKLFGWELNPMFAL